MPSAVFEMPKRAPTIPTPDEAYDLAVQLLARKARTAAEVVDALAAKDVDQETIETVLGRLKSHRHLDDAELASDQAFSLLDGKGMSPAAAVQTLVQRGVAERTAREAVDAAREGRSERELAQAALLRRTKGRALDDRALAKEGRALARLGWDEEVVARVLEKARTTESE